MAKLPTGTTKYYELVRCPQQNKDGGRVRCSKVHEFTEEQAGATELSVITMISESEEANVIDFTDVSFSFSEGLGQELIVPPEAGRCYGPSAEVLITSTTNDYRGGKVVTMTSSGVRASPDGGGEEVGFLSIEGDPGDPSTEMSSPERSCGAEVALLSRNVAFVASTKDDPDDSNPLHGGHLIVMHTTGEEARQHLQGAEVRRFGRQGELGRYVIFLFRRSTKERAYFGREAWLLGSTPNKRESLW